MRIEQREVDLLLRRDLVHFWKLPVSAIEDGIDVQGAKQLDHDLFSKTRVAFKKYWEPRTRGNCLTRGVKVDELQFPEIHALVRFAATCMDIHPPQCYVSNAEVPAYSCGLRHQGVISISSALIESLNERELLYVVGHELCHLVREDGPQSKLEDMFIDFVDELRQKGEEPPEDLCRNARIAFFEKQKREMIADRAGLICCQDIEAAECAFLAAMLGSREMAVRVNRDHYIEEHLLALETFPFAEDLLMSTHPVSALRLRELRKFHASTYPRIVATYGQKLKFA